MTNSWPYLTPRNFNHCPKHSHEPTLPRSPSLLSHIFHSASQAPTSMLGRILQSSKFTLVPSGGLPFSGAAFTVPSVPYSGPFSDLPEIDDEISVSVIDELILEGEQRDSSFVDTILLSSLLVEEATGETNGDFSTTPSCEKSEEIRRSGKRELFGVKKSHFAKELFTFSFQPCIDRSEILFRTSSSKYTDSETTSDVTKNQRSIKKKVKTPVQEKEGQLKIPQKEAPRFWGHLQAFEESFFAKSPKNGGKKTRRDHLKPKEEETHILGSICSQGSVFKASTQNFGEKSAIWKPRSLKREGAVDTDRPEKFWRMAAGSAVIEKSTSKIDDIKTDTMKNTIGTSSKRFTSPSKDSLERSSSFFGVSSLTKNSCKNDIERSCEDSFELSEAESGCSANESDNFILEDIPASSVGQSLFLRAFDLMYHRDLLKKKIEPQNSLHLLHLEKVKKASQEKGEN